MTDQTDDFDFDNADVSISIDIVPDDTLELTSISFGLGETKALLTVEVDEENNNITFAVKASGFDSHRELLEMLRDHLDVIEAGIEQDEEDEA